jgi:hypothetical protein
MLIVGNSVFFLQIIGLLKGTLLCTQRNCCMTWSIYNKMKDKYVRKCVTKTWSKYKTALSIKSSPMFEDCRADLNLVICAVYLCAVVTWEKLACQLTGLSRHTIIMVYGFLRVMCRRYFENNLIKLAGGGCCVPGWWKYARIQTKASPGRAPQNERWVCTLCIYFYI